MTQDVFMAKLHGLNFDMNALNFMYDSLTGRKKRLKINFRTAINQLFPCNLLSFLEEYFLNGFQTIF